MKTLLDDEKYEIFQEYILETIVKEIKQTLEEKGVQEELIYDITGDLAFGISAIIDSSRGMEVNGEDVLPFLAFSKSEKERDTLIINEGGSYMHEMAFGYTDGVFEEDQD